VEQLNGALGASAATAASPADTNPLVDLVGSTYEQAVLDGAVDALVLIYTRWSSASRAVAPDYSALAQRHVGDASVLIAQIDATRNDILAPQIRSFPTLVFFPATARGLNDAVVYGGEWDLEAMASFLERERSVGGVETDPSKDEGQPCSDEQLRAEIDRLSSELTQVRAALATEQRVRAQCEADLHRRARTGGVDNGVGVGVASPERAGALPDDREL